MQKCLHKKLLIPPHCLSVLCFSPLCVFFLCFWDWEKPVLINMTWISFCQAYRQFLLWFKSVECEVVYGNQGRPMYYGNVAKLLWYFRNYRNKMRFDMFVCDRSDSHVPFLGIDLQCYIKLDYFSTYVSCLLLVEKWEPHRIRFSSFKVAMELLFIFCRLKHLLWTELHCNFRQTAVGFCGVVIMRIW